ncbi:MAG: general secretion pathway protein C, partial [Acidovorax sp.]
MMTIPRSNSHSPWGVRLGTLALWALAAASVVFWGLRLSAPRAGLGVPPVAPAPIAPDAQ